MACCASASCIISKSSGTRHGRCSRERTTGSSMSPAGSCERRTRPGIGKAGENSTIWESPSPKFIMGGSDEEKYDHPTQKPVDLMRRPILNHTKRGELVYEPFLGSGTTLAAAELTERVCCGIELDPKYVDVIVQRWQTLTGKKAKLEGDGRTFEEIAAGTRTWKPASRRAPGRRGALLGAGGLVGGIAAAASALRVGHRCATFGPRWLLLRWAGLPAKSAVELAGSCEEMQRFDRRCLKESSMGASRVFGAKHHAPSQRFEKDTGAYVPD